jgi:hypothetical protein
MRKLAIATAVALGPAAAGAVEVPVDLSTWIAEGGNSNWNVAGDNNSVVQTVNGDPTVFHNNTNSQGVALKGTIQVGSTTDDDFIGFVLGFDSGDFASAGADFILIDWKQGDQANTCPSGSTGNAGLAISRVTGVGDFNAFWCHNSPVDELARANTLGSTGWVEGQEYEFDLIFNPTQIRVFVDGTEELNITGTFENGAFGFYNQSQDNVTYAGLTQREAPPPQNQIPLPGALPLMGLGLAALGIATRRRRRG